MRIEIIDLIIPGLFCRDHSPSPAQMTDDVPVDDGIDLQRLLNVGHGTFQRKTAEQILTGSVNINSDSIDITEDASTPVHADGADIFLQDRHSGGAILAERRQDSSDSDLMFQAISAGVTVSFGSTGVVRGAVLAKLLQHASQSIDPVTGLAVEAKADWVAARLGDFDSIASSPRAADGSVVGVTESVKSSVAGIEKLLNNPAPEDAANALERVVAVKLTPVTVSTQDLPDAATLDDIFNAFEKGL